MNIAGFQGTSFVDFPGNIASVVFTPGCNLNCFYCHNRWLVNEQPDIQTIPPSEVLECLKRRKGKIDGVVLSGGEPTLQEGLASFLGELKSMGYKTKLDTNGTRPALLASFIRSGSLDYVAMDIKAPRDKYESVCGVPVDLDAVDAGEASCAKSVSALLSDLFLAPAQWVSSTDSSPWWGMVWKSRLMTSSP